MTGWKWSLLTGMTMLCLACGTAEPSDDLATTDTGATDTQTAVTDTPTVPEDTATPPTDTAGPSDSSSPTEDALPSDTAAPEKGQACPNNTRVGYFEIANWDFYSSVAGQIYDAVNPLEVLQPQEEQNGCILMQKKNPFCDPPCGAGQLCTQESECVPYPAAQSVGSVTVEGLLVDVTMEPKATKAYAESNVPFPCFDAGAPITVTAAGDDLPGFKLEGIGVAPLEVAEGNLTAEKGKDLTVTWTPVEGAGRIFMSLNVDQHGNSPVTMMCDIPDTGSFSIPGALVTTLLEYGVSGFATFDIYRRTVDSVNLDVGCIELRVVSWAAGKVVVEGHVPCFTDKDCPEGETCKVIINTCTGSGD